MKIIFFQGNPGKEYEQTRHNIAFEFADFLAAKLDIVFQDKSKFNSKIAEIKYKEEKILLVKPQSFYNQTGPVVQNLCNFYKVDFKQDLLVIHDDLTLDFGTIRTRKKGRDAGNNGLKSIINSIGQEFPRIKIGTKNELLSRASQVDFVLSKISKKESEKLPLMFANTEKLMNDFLASNFANQKISIS